MREKNINSIFNTTIKKGHWFKCQIEKDTEG